MSVIPRRGNVDKKYRIAAAILIGGRSSRMGSPKEDLIIKGDGRTFLDRMCDEVDNCFGKCLCGRYLSVRKGQFGKRNGYMSVEDKYDDIGPMGGLVSVLSKAASDGCDAVLLLACDMINYTDREIMRICAGYEGQDILFARTDGRDIQPLASIYSTGMKEAAAKMAGAGDHRMRNLMAAAESVGYYDAKDAGAYTNVNTPEDAALS